MESVPQVRGDHGVDKWQQIILQLLKNFERHHRGAHNTDLPANNRACNGRLVGLTSLPNIAAVDFTYNNPGCQGYG